MANWLDGVLAAWFILTGISVAYAWDAFLEPELSTGLPHGRRTAGRTRRVGDERQEDTMQGVHQATGLPHLAIRC